MTIESPKHKHSLLLLFCWLSYCFAQLGRYSYGSNITLIMNKYAVDHSAASLPLTLFFFAYGFGQIIVGLFCHKFNRKLQICISLTLSGVINVVIFFGAAFFTIKYLWLLNGFVQATLWPTILLILRENLSGKELVKAGSVIATASTGGKFLAMGICALFAIDTSIFTYCFLAAGVLMFAVGVAFLFVANDIKEPCKTMQTPAELKTRNGDTPKQPVDKGTILLLFLLAEFSLACYAISGGLTSWVPAIVKETYGLSDALSIFMSILLPLFMTLVAFIYPLVNKKIKSPVVISLLAFIFGTITIAGVLLVIDVHWLPIMILFVIEAISMSFVSYATTVNAPLMLKGRFDAGFLAGCFNGACYVGTAISTYVLGVVADTRGWNSAFIVVIAIAAVSAVLAALYLVYSHKHKNNIMVSENAEDNQKS